MNPGYWGRILRVNLSTKEIGVDLHDEKFYRTYLGGRGVISYYLLTEVPANCDPLGPENVLVFAPSILTGTSLPGVSRNSIGAKSPLTGGYGEGEGGGDWGAKLRWAKYDGLVVTGASEKPVYINITADKVEIVDASELWGTEPYECSEKIASATGDAKASMAMIGKGGEQQVSFACIALGTHNYVGRSGLGAVMGSKQLKAVVVSGDHRLEIADKKKIQALSRKMVEGYKAGMETMTEMGTARGVPVVNGAGGFPTRNFQEGSFEGYENVTGRRMTDTILVDRKTCFGCPVRCKRVVEVKDKKCEVSRKYGGPEYESIAGFGSNCGIDDLEAVAKANEICNRYTVDTISAAAMISGAFECADRNLLPSELVDGLDLQFGSVDGMLDLLVQICEQKGLGEILSRGPQRAVEILGKETEAYFLHVKNQPLPFQEPRWKKGMGLGYALSPSGAEHMANIHDVLYTAEEAPTFAGAKNMGIMDALESNSLGAPKARLWAYMGINRSIHNILSICSFMPYNFDQITDAVQAVTGWNISSWEVMKVSERCFTMTRWFNVREGFTSEDDMLPQRFHEPLQNGALKGEFIDKDAFRETLDLTYSMLGWNEKTGVPGKGKLLELDLGWLVEA